MKMKMSHLHLPLPFGRLLLVLPREARLLWHWECWEASLRQAKTYCGTEVYGRLVSVATLNQGQLVHCTEVSAEQRQSRLCCPGAGLPNSALWMPGNPQAQHALQPPTMVWDFKQRGWVCSSLRMSCVYLWTFSKHNKREFAPIPAGKVSH